MAQADTIIGDPAAKDRIARAVVPADCGGIRAGLERLRGARSRGRARRWVGCRGDGRGIRPADHRSPVLRPLPVGVQLRRAGGRCSGAARGRAAAGSISRERKLQAGCRGSDPRFEDWVAERTFDLVLLPAWWFSLCVHPATALREHCAASPTQTFASSARRGARRRSAINARSAVRAERTPPPRTRTPVGLAGGAVVRPSAGRSWLGR